MDIIPPELFQHFNLNIIDLKNLYLVSKWMADKLDLSFVKVKNEIALKTKINPLFIKFLNDVSILCFLNDIYMFKNVKRLDLSRFKGVLDASKFSEVEDINLSGVYIENIDCLYKVKRLNLSCSSVTNVNSLRSALKLDISYTSVSDVSNLTRLEELHMEKTNVSDISKLINLSLLKVSTIKPYLNQLDYLKNLKIVDAPTFDINISEIYNRYSFKFEYIQDDYRCGDHILFYFMQGRNNRCDCPECMGDGPGNIIIGRNKPTYIVSKTRSWYSGGGSNK